MDSDSTDSVATLTRVLRSDLDALRRQVRRKYGGRLHGLLLLEASKALKLHAERLEQESRS